MPEISCLCGRVRVATDTDPEFVHECNCTLCSKTGARWAYYAPDQVQIEGETSAYVRDDKPQAAAQIRFCPNCGTTTHFTLTPAAIEKFGNGMMGVNVRLLDESALAGIELRYPDGRNWSGEGPFDYVRPPRMMGAAG